MKVHLHGLIKGSYMQNLREAIRNRFASCCTSMKKISSGLQHLVKEMLDDVKHSQTVDIPGDFVSSTFIGHLMV